MVPLVAILISGLCLSHSSFGLQIDPSRELVSAEIVAAGFVTPTGIALDPKTGRFFVAERTANRISIIEDRKPVPLFDEGFAISDDVPKWMRSRSAEYLQIMRPEFRSPQDIAFDEKGQMYVAEGGEGGRILQFQPLEKGEALAHIIPTPWMGPSRGYTSLALATNGRLFCTAGLSIEDKAFGFGSVLVRNPDGDWDLIDYGPFAHFSSLAFDEKTGILAVGESYDTDLVWYDADRETAVGGHDRISGVRHVALLPDGITIVARSHENGEWTIEEVDPITRESFQWISGLTAVGDLFVEPESGDLYVTLEEEGQVLRIRRMGELRSHDDHMLGRLLKKFEHDWVLPPKEWPEFFRRFIEKLELVRAVNERHTDRPALEITGARIPMTMSDFAQSIPVVAGKFKTTLLRPQGVEKDPIKEINFVILFPNNSMVTKDSVAPSLSLVRIEHESGLVRRTSFLPNRNGVKVSEEMSWADMPEVLVAFPSGYYVRPNHLTESDLLRVYFLGLGLGPDYWLDIHRLEGEMSRMVIEKSDGTRLDYKLEPYRESLKAGGETVLAAGITHFTKGWYRIGTKPVIWNRVEPESAAVKARHLRSLAQLQMFASSPSPSYRTTPGEPTPNELDFRRRVLIRAATRWQDVRM